MYKIYFKKNIFFAKILPKSWKYALVFWALLSFYPINSHKINKNLSHSAKVQR